MLGNLETPIIAKLKAYKEQFASIASEITGVDPAIASHALKVDPNAKPVAQKKRSMSAEKEKAAEEEVDKLKKAGFIREVRYTEWLSNVVMVK